MADDTKTALKVGPKKQGQLLADGMLLDGVEYVRGDTVEVDEKQFERLEKFGSVGPVGVIERRQKAEAEIVRLRAEAEQAVADISATPAAAAPLAAESVPAEPTNRRQINRNG